MYPFYRKKLNLPFPAIGIALPLVNLASSSSKGLGSIVYFEGTCTLHSLSKIRIFPPTWTIASKLFFSYGAYPS